MSKLRQILLCCIWAHFIGSPISACAQVANVISSVGAVNRGAATAMPLDASNAQDWNPASITDLPITELDLNMQTSFPKVSVNAFLPANSLNGALPDQAVSGEIGNGNKFNYAPSIGFVKKLDGSRWAFGILTASTIGSGVDYPKSRDPLTSPPPPNGVGSGRIKIRGDLIYIAPTLAYKVSNHFSVGVQPEITVSSLQASPFASAEPDDANHDGIATFPSTNRAWATGIGVQGGVYYRYKDLHLGTSLKSPQWFTPYNFKSHDELGNPRHFSVHINAPMILSMGIGYSGLPRTKLAMDVRHVNYEDTTGFDRVGFTKGGATKGLGWRNVWAYIWSAQYEVTKKCRLRVAYSFSQAPIQPQFTSFSVASPALVQHQMSFAVAYLFRPDMALAVSYQHGFANSSEGPINRVSGPIPGSSVKVTSSLNSVAASWVILFK